MASRLSHPVEKEQLDINIFKNISELTTSSEDLDLKQKSYRSKMFLLLLCPFWHFFFQCSTSVTERIEKCYKVSADPGVGSLSSLRRRNIH